MWPSRRTATSTGNPPIARTLGGALAFQATTPTTSAAAAASPPARNAHPPDRPAGRRAAAPGSGGRWRTNQSRWASIEARSAARAGWARIRSACGPAPSSASSRSIASGVPSEPVNPPDPVNPPVPSLMTPPRRAGGAPPLRTWTAPVHGAHRHPEHLRRPVVGQPITQVASAISPVRSSTSASRLASSSRPEIACSASGRGRWAEELFVDDTQARPGAAHPQQVQAPLRRGAVEPREGLGVGAVLEAGLDRADVDPLHHVPAPPPGRATSGTPGAGRSVRSVRTAWRSRSSPCAYRMRVPGPVGHVSDDRGAGHSNGGEVA